MNNKLYKLMNWPRIEGIVYSEEANPQEILGVHTTGKNVLFQMFWPGAVKVNVHFMEEKRSEAAEVVSTAKLVLPMEMADENGFFACLYQGKKPQHYEYEIIDAEGNSRMIKDAYAFAPVSLSEKDAVRFTSGIHYTIYEHLGAHPCTRNGVAGTQFAVWAPNAVRVSVVGDFNNWDGRIYPMIKDGTTGIFDLFIPDVQAGDCYKYEIRKKGGLTVLKADPYAFRQQLRPDTASIVEDSHYSYQDAEWMKNRKKYAEKNASISVYELYLGSFRHGENGKESLSYRELAPLVAEYAKEMGYTHVELMPVMEHPLDASWGYQVIGYYAPTARYGTPDDFRYFVDTLHQAGIGVILDWVPAHFPRDTYGLAEFDGTCLYEHADPRKGSHPHWGTLIYNYGRPEVSNYLIANALYWAEQFHADGIRMDAVASMLYLDYGRKDGEWVANIYGGNENLEAIEMIKHLNSIMKKRNPDVLMIAEESTAWPKGTGALDDEGLGFDLKWNMGFMNDYLAYISYDPYFRAHHHNELTFSMIYAYSENFMLPFSHDEVVHGKSSMIGKMPGTIEDKFANLRLTYGYVMTHPGKKLLFMGQDIAEFQEFDETRQTKWELLKEPAHKGIHDLVRDLNHLYQELPALYEKDTEADGFQWINCISPEKCMLSYMRKALKPEQTLVVVANFANIEQEFCIGVPMAGKYKEILNTDDKAYGGKGRVNGRAIPVNDEEYDGQPCSFTMKAAPLSLSIFKFVAYTAKEKQQIENRKAETKAIRLAQEAGQRAKEAEAEAEELTLRAKELKKQAEEIMQQAQKALQRAKEEEKLASIEWKKAEEAAKKAK